MPAKNQVKQKKKKQTNPLTRRFKKFFSRVRVKKIGKQNIIVNDGSLRNVRYDIVGNNNTIEIKNEAVVSNLLIYVRGDNHKLTIGKNCIVKSGEIFFENENCEIVIGQKTTIESARIAATEKNTKITIGDDCMLSYFIEIRTSDSHSIIDKETMKRINNAQNIVIGNHVWIGAYTLVLKGVTIGHDSIVGAKSLVNKSIPDSTIAAGIPAKVKRSNITWDRELIDKKNA